MPAARPPRSPMAHRSPTNLGVLLVLVALPVWAQPQILLFPAVGQPGEVSVHGRVLKEAPTGGSNVLSKNLRRLTAPNWEGAPVEITWRGVTVNTRSGHDGVFEATFKLPGERRPAPGLDIIEARVPGAVAKTSVRIVDDAAPFIVISDFDDTVAVTNVTSRRGLLKSALLQDGTTQPAVNGMNLFYRCLIDEQPGPTPGLAFVSGSPHQFAPRILTFLTRHGFPLAGLYLRDLGPDTLSGYKQPAIRKILGRMKQKVIFIGDSGEHDPEVYAEMRREFPDRVLEIYIRDAGRTSEPSRFEDMVLFKDGQDAAAHAVKKGYISQACYEQSFGQSVAGAGAK